MSQTRRLASPPARDMYAACTKPFMRTVVLLSVLAAGLAVVALLLLARKPPLSQEQDLPSRGRVQCYFSAKGMLCMIERMAGRRGSSVCWDVNASCRNGTIIQWSGCGPVPRAVGGVEAVKFTLDDVPGLLQCDAIMSSSVSNARVR